MDGRFLTAFIIPESWDVMGYKLKPFSLRHMMVLAALDSPFVGSRPPTCPEDVLVFLRVCSSEHPSQAFRKPTLRDRWRILMMETRTEYFIEQVKAIFEYIETCNSSPKVWTKPEEGNQAEKRRENIPGPLSLATTLMSKMNLSHEEAWNMTLGQTIWYLTAYAVSEGSDIRILTTQEEAKASAEREALIAFQEQMLARIKGNKKPDVAT